MSKLDDDGATVHAMRSLRHGAFSDHIGAFC